jgi:ubiquinone/menaquinone biosynthesis C-methylase UbiE
LSRLTAVTISNLDHHDRIESNYAPYAWVRQDAENLTVTDDSYDWVVVNAGLHHCGSPHRALCEMLRVARQGVLVLEARDSFLMRIAVRFGLTVQHELEPVQRLAMSKNRMVRASIHLVGAMGWLFRTLLPRQGNMFAFAVSKRGEVQPWLCETPDGFEIDKTYMDDRFSPEKYRKR